MIVVLYETDVVLYETDVVPYETDISISVSTGLPLYTGWLDDETTNEIQL